MRIGTGKRPSYALARPSNRSLPPAEPGSNRFVLRVPVPGPTLCASKGVTAQVEDGSITARFSLPLGIRYMALGAFWFSVMSLLVRVTGSRIGSQQVVLIRGLITMLATIWMLRRAGVHGWWGTRRDLLLLRAVLGFTALSCLYYALVHLPLADATTIQYTNPVWTALLATWYLGERIDRREAVLVLASLAGVVLIARPSALFGSGTGLPPFAVTVALVGALCSAGAYVTVRKLGATEHPLVIVFHLTLFTVPAAIPGTLLNPVWPTPFEWLALFGVGLTAQAGQVYLTRGLQLERAGRATSIGYLQIVFAAIWGALFFREIPDRWSIAGAALIVGSTLAVGRRRSAESG